MPVNASAMLYLLQVAITWSSRIEPPGSAIYCTPLLCARSMLSPNGKNASEPRQTSVFCASHSFCSSLVNTSGFTLKVFCHTPSASTSCTDHYICSFLSINHVLAHTMNILPKIRQNSKPGNHCFSALYALFLFPSHLFTAFLSTSCIFN